MSSENARKGTEAMHETLEAAAAAAQVTKDAAVVASHANRSLDLTDNDTERGVGWGLQSKMLADPAVRTAPGADTVVPPRHSATGAWAVTAP